MNNRHNSSPNLTHHQSFPIRNYEAGPRGHAPIQTLFNYLIEVAGNHAHQLGVSLTDLFAQGQTWVLSRLDLRVEKYPTWPGTAHLTTWPSSRHDLYTTREFILEDDSGNHLAIASTSWMIIDWKTRRPVRIPEKFEGFVNHDRGRVIDTDFPRLPTLDNADPDPDNTVDSTPIHEQTFQPLRSQLDLNRHINAVRSVDWALETVPQEIWDNHVLKQLEVGYRAECLYGENVVARCRVEDDPPGYRIVHSLRRQGSGKELTQLVTTWREE